MFKRLFSFFYVILLMHRIERKMKLHHCTIHEAIELLAKDKNGSGYVSPEAATIAINRLKRDSNYTKGSYETDQDSDDDYADDDAVLNHRTGHHQQHRYNYDVDVGGYQRYSFSTRQEYEASCG